MLAFHQRLKDGAAALKIKAQELKTYEKIRKHSLDISGAVVDMVRPAFVAGFLLGANPQSPNPALGSCP